MTKLTNADKAVFREMWVRESLILEKMVRIIKREGWPDALRNSQALKLIAISSLIDGTDA